MSPKLEAALKETLEIIDKRIQAMVQEGIDEPQPKILEMDDGVLINYFEKWSVYHGDVFKRSVNVDWSNLFGANIFFIPKNGRISDDNEHIKTIICLDGKIEVTQKEENKTYNSLTAVDINTNKYSVLGLKDSFILLILR